MGRLRRHLSANLERMNNSRRDVGTKGLFAPRFITPFVRLTIESSEWNRKVTLTVGHEDVQVQTVLAEARRVFVLNVDAKHFEEELVVLLERLPHVGPALALRHGAVPRVVPLRRHFGERRREAELVDGWMSVRDAEVGGDPLDAEHFHVESRDLPLFGDLDLRRLPAIH